MLVDADFALYQERFDGPRRFMRDVLLWLGFRLLVKVEIRGLENIPPAGPTIVMMNHRGAVDPFVVLGAVRPRFVVPMSKIENFRIPLIGRLMRWWGAYPVRRNEVDRAALQTTVDLLKNGNLVLMAPEGTRQPAMIEGKDGMTYVAIKANAAVVPLGMDGTREFFHNVKRLRRTRITMNFGPAFRFRTNGRERVPREEMHCMTQEAMYQLAKLVPEHLRGVYSDPSKATTDTLEFVTIGEHD
jgi:1-acyl-sn-glycerol-3-phosphate acyltransferase